MEKIMTVGYVIKLTNNVYLKDVCFYYDAKNYVK